MPPEQTPKPTSPVLAALVGVALIGTATWLLVNYREDAADRSGVSAVAASSTTTAPEAAGFETADGSSPGVGRGKVFTYTVEAEQGAGISPGALAEDVDRILGDVRGWTIQDRSFQRLPEQGSITVSLATSPTAERLCADPAADGPTTCFVDGRVVIDVASWERAPADWPEGQRAYQTYLVSHGFGHALGAPDAGCPEAGATAPVMVRQPESLEGCVANPWPFPTVVED